MAVPSIPHLPPLEPAPRLRWGVIGVGNIAGRFVDALARRSSQETIVVSARSIDRADEFARSHGIPFAVGSVGELVCRDDIDVVYVATPHQTHREIAEAALSAGKHVLVEKPIAHTTEDAKAITGLARSEGLMAMEAMWTRYLPQSRLLGEILRVGVIGEVVHVDASFGFAAPFNPEHRLWSPALAGGALLDAGVYPVSFISSVLGTPIDVSVQGTLAPTGVDDHSHLSLSYARATAAATTSLRGPLPGRAVISGTQGRIEVDAPFFLPSGFSLSTSSHWMPDPDAIHWRSGDLERPYDGLHYQADALSRFVAEGRAESPVHTHAETVSVVSTLERARQLLGAI